MRMRLGLGRGRKQGGGAERRRSIGAGSESSWTSPLAIAAACDWKTRGSAAKPLHHIANGGRSQDSRRALLPLSSVSLWGGGPPKAVEGGSAATLLMIFVCA